VKSLTRSPKVVSIETGIHLAAASRSDKAYAFIRRKIVRGELKLGQAISRRQLARELRMSFLPVSEAFIRLEWEGLLESRPRAGTRVRIPTKKDVEDQYVVREALETQAARLFAEKATAEEKADLHKLALLLDSSNENGVSRLSYLNLHEKLHQKKLHQKITEYAHCPALSGAVEETYALASAWMCVDRSDDASSGHQSLVEALASGDAATAAKAMSLHIHARKQEALARLKPYFALKRSRGAHYSRGFK
jgi:DNA-binding GntR family transcriptional regulator